MIRRVRNLDPGEIFILKRTGERYVFVRREYGKPGGARYVVKKRPGEVGTLHPSCHVEWDGSYDLDILTHWLGFGTDPLIRHEIEKVLLYQWAKRRGMIE